jgi:triacylglycerol lipase
MKTLLAVMIMSLPSVSSAAKIPEHVILLHGLCRSSGSMKFMEQALLESGYKVLNVDYPSRSASVSELAEAAIGKAVDHCQSAGATKIHIVTHSLGGILVRSYLSQHTITHLGRVVMLGPPNQGSEVVDTLGALRIFKLINGIAGSELGTVTNSTPNRLGAANFCVGIIAGDRSINWINSMMIPGRDDGKVSIERTKLEAMKDHIVIHATHPFLMRNKTSIRQTIHFLRNGQFERRATS